MDNTLFLPAMLYIYYTYIDIVYNSIAQLIK